ncbi:MAG TPA: type I phosphomannose isomerase catalytic subunit [Spirochaetia bacterium]|nr:type I phosphomannose isomerase catalytic subunit [Spirochaetia bacterium]
MKVPVFKTAPVFQSRPWGGRAMADRLGKRIPDGLVGESWEVSAHPNGVSRVSGGPLDGTPLDELVRKAGADLLGPRTYRKYGDNFPLLVKLVDVNAIASVQVHPNDEQAQRLEGYPWGKTEAWYIIDRAPDAKFFIGLVPGVTPASFRESLETGTTRELLASPEVKPGDCILVPPGTIHAVGQGVLILEIQQSSDITYRVYDWDRTDEQGKKRDLHIEKAQQVIDFDARPRIFRTEQRSDVLGRILAGGTYEIFQARVATGLDLPARSSFSTGTVVEGELRLVAGDARIELRCGDSFVVPAGNRVRLERAPGRSQTRLENVGGARRRSSQWATVIVTQIV